MVEAVGSLAQSIGAAFVLSNLGAAELIVSLLFAAGLAGSAVRGRGGEAERREDPARHPSSRQA